MQSLIPGPGTQRQFRQVLGQFATGVTIVTAQTPVGPIGMTANSFSSVSMDPPLVMWCPAKSSARLPAFQAANHFAIHVMGLEDRQIAESFAKSGTDFDGVDLKISPHGVPLLENCLARFECETHAIHEAGDHLIILGQVLSASHREGDGLAFCQGKYGRFQQAD